MVREASAFLFRLLRNSDHVGRAESMEVKRMFGPFPAAQVSKAHSTVTRLVALLPSSVIHADEKNLSEDKSIGDSDGVEFGAKIRFSFESTDCHWLGNGITEEYLKRLDEVDKEATTAKTKVADLLTPEFISQAINTSLAKTTEKKAEKKTNGTLPTVATPAAAASSMDASWLRRCCEEHFVGGTSGMSVHDMFAVLFDMLSSLRSNDEIQNEVTF